MSESLKMRDVERPKLIRRDWALQGYVLDALIRILTEVKLDPLSRIAEGIEQNSVLRVSKVLAAESVRAYMRGRYKRTTDQAFGFLLDELKQQRQLLMECEDIPPTTGTGMSPEMYKALNDRHHEWIRSVKNEERSE